MGNTFPLVDAAGSIECGVNMTIDITERKRAEQALQESEYYLKEAQAIAHIGHWILNPETGEVTGSDEFFRIFGLNREEATLDAFAEVVHPEDREYDLSHIRRGIEQAQGWNIEHRLVCRDGTEKTVQAIGEAITDDAGNTVLLMGIVQDITERKRAEEALRASEQRYALAQQAANIGSWDWDIATGRVLWSDTIEPIFGFPRGGFTATYQAFLECVHPDDRRLVSDAVEASVEHGADYEIEHRIVWPDGTVRWVSEKGDVTRDADGRAVRMLGIAQDITEYKQSTRDLERVFNLSGYMVCVADIVTASFLKVSPSFEEVLGYTAAELVERPFLDFVHPDDVESTKAVIEEKLRQGVQVIGFENRYRCKDGSYKWLGWTSRPVVEEGITFAIAYDITERKRAEQALKQSEATLRSIFRAAPVGIGLVSDRILKRVNDQICQMVGYTADELVEQNARMLYPTEEDYQYVGREKYAQIGARGTGTVETRWQRKDGNIIDVLLSSTPLDPSDLSAGVTFTALDITDRVQAEALIRQLNEELEERVIARTVELKAANEELEAFTYSVSHDLRAPLRHIGGFARILVEEHAATLDAEARRRLQIIQDSAGKMGTLIDDLLTLSRLARKPTERIAVNCERMVRDVWSELVAGRDPATVRFELEPLPAAQADAGLLRQVWLNLLENALKYTANRRPGEIVVGSFESGGATWYRVRDNGVGFDPRYADKLFGVFQRLHREEEFPGTGVGLAIVQRIVRKHGGQVRGRSEVDRGATFEFTLGS